MYTDFFEYTANRVKHLNQTEIALFEYVVKNLEKVRKMSIQQFASERFLSTTTIFRFTKKLGFSGYSDFIECLLITEHQRPNSEVPPVFYKKDYSQEYLKNLIEAVRVIPQSKIEQVLEILKRNPMVYILTDEHTNDIGRYVERLFIGIGLKCYFPEVEYQCFSVRNNIEDKDLLIVLSYTGNDKMLISLVEKIFAKKHPSLLSITRSDNNVIQNMSDINFYIFVDEIIKDGINLTSKVAIIMILEVLIYNYIS